MHLIVRHRHASGVAVLPALVAAILLVPHPASAATCPPAGTPGLNTIEGTQGDDSDSVLHGTLGPDLILAKGGDDEIFGWGGDDVICGGPGEDIVYHYGTTQAPSGYTEDINLATGTATGTAGNDTLIDVEQAFGSDYNDRLVGSTGDNFLYGGEGNDLISAGDGRDVVFGDGSADQYVNNPDGADTIYGDGGDDYINGNGGGDQLFGDAGLDMLNGEGGNDALDGGADEDFGYYACNYVSPFCTSYTGPGITADLGARTVSGGQGNDSIAAGSDGKSSVENVIGSDFNDSLTGAPGQVNTLAPRIGTDTVNGGGDNDGDFVDYNCINSNETPCGGYAGTNINLAAQIATGPQGTDALLNIQSVKGSPNSDQITGSDVSNELFGYSGDDTITGGAGDDGIAGDEGDDALSGGAGDGDRLRYDLLRCGGSGVDVRLTGGTALGNGNDTIDGGSFEQVIGSPCDDTLVGSNRRDTILGLGGSDTLYGRGDNDLLVPHASQADVGEDAGANGNDTVFGGQGQDEVSYLGASSGVVADLSSGVVSADGDNGSDSVFGVESAQGSKSNDKISGTSATNTLLGAAGNDALNGAGGDDYLDGEAGADVIDGGPGSDATDYLYGPQSVSVKLQRKSALESYSDGVTYKDKLIGLEAIAGTDGNDRMIGSKHSDALFGEGGNDGKMIGGAGNDLLIGGTGKQSFDGGSGKDTCSGGKKAKRCERRQLDSEGRRDVTFLTGLRDYRDTGELQQALLDQGLGLMKVRRLVEPPFATVPSSR